MDFNLLLWAFFIIIISRVISKKTGLVDILLYVILGLVFTKFGLINKEDDILKFLSEMGVILLMFYAGWHEDSKTFLQKVWENKYLALIAALGPFTGAYIGFNLLNFSFNESLIAGFIFTATAVPYTLGVLNSLELNKTSGSKSILAAAMADDFLSIVLVSSAFSTLILLETTADPDFLEIVIGTSYKLFLLLVSFFLFFVMATFILPQSHKETQTSSDGLHKLILKLRHDVGVNSFINKYLQMDLMIPIALFLLFALGISAHHFGLHMAIGAYLVGLILTQEMFAINKEENNICYKEYKKLDTFIYQLTNNFLGPFFFIYLGTQLSIKADNFVEVASYSILTFLFVAVFQVLSAYFGARKTAGLDKKNSLLVAFGMLPRDVLAFVILEIAISNNLVEGETIFSTVIVVSILLLNLTTPLALGYIKKTYQKEFEEDLKKVN